jgi:hypothetical protein
VPSSFAVLACARSVMVERKTNTDNSNTVKYLRLLWNKWDKMGLLIGLEMDPLSIRMWVLKNGLLETENNEQVRKSGYGDVEMRLKIGAERAGGAGFGDRNF